MTTLPGQRMQDRAAGLPLAPLTPIEPGPAPFAAGHVWLITFTDLVALILTFFVMLFAMSSVEQQKWRALLSALIEAPVVWDDETLSAPVTALGIEEDQILVGSDLDYLTSLLRQQTAAEPILAAATVQRLDRRIVVSLPADLLFAPGATALDKRAIPAVVALGAVLAHLGNRVEVAGHADPTPPGEGFASNWELSLSRAVSVADMLARAGQGREVVARGHGASHFARISAALPEAQRRALGRRVDILIHERAEGP
jgi:chemotaxis protein MotB